jgi:hypothetical protein
MSRSRKHTEAKRKSAVRKTCAHGKTDARLKATTAIAVKTKSPKGSSKSAGTNRAEGIRLFKLAGRPTKEQFILVYGERGPKMTWAERAKAGVSAKQFQSALPAKQRGV